MLEHAGKLLDGAGALLICAGAGMGVDSGLPDFRGGEGFWRAYPPYARLGLRFEELADPRHFADDPELAWGFYGHRLALYRQTVPHDGFRLLREFGTRLPHGVRVFTSNVDGQFQAAGFEHVAEAHGSIHHLQCLARCTDDIWPASSVDVRLDEDTMRAVPPLPSCPRCGGLARPNILMFGDFSWVPDRSEAQLAELTAWRRTAGDLVVVELGAGQAVPTVRRYAELASAATGALIRINPREPEIRHNRGVSIAAGALETIQALVSEKQR
ncbi:SIR2 family NAD-dependent protein deacylase [Amycolatopsis vancoresmycina]|uniref:protein acetyllysine N-acetyltransferase n=1 Tax=Amycolatopsis vancoresmycina DSM 44592 TaxID=1292037 RepID=R1I010_9PSEU|nr:Sir2 family NAD-dependent protein deacetylase [Amycolatopsis vancoresmycina]EOD65876.1 SIR2 family NAD-dependent deacetylase [Amycolatopsis vancoresmycina DSM 44592]